MTSDTGRITPGNICMWLANLEPGETLITSPRSWEHIRPQFSQYQRDARNGEHRKKLKIYHAEVITIKRVR